MKIATINIIILITMHLNSWSQDVCDTMPFLGCNKNYIIVNNQGEIENLQQKFSNLNTASNNSAINIIHIGDSHLQAGFLTEKIKQNLFQHFSLNDSVASPGFIFPFTIAQTNNPFYYKIDYTGNWSWGKNTSLEKNCKIGLSGITVKTNDSTATFSIKMKNDKYNCPQKYFFNTIKIFHNTAHTINLRVNNQNASSKNNVSVVHFAQLIDSVGFEIEIKDTSKFFELYGIILQNDNSNINYHTIGVNGATAQSYLKCEYFSSQLAYINPDLLIISLGTNEAYDDNFSILEHEYLLKDLVLQIKDVAPNAALIFITPNSHIKFGKDNTKVSLVRSNIIKVCKEFNLSYWDYYAVMGGKGSIEEWHAKGLTGEDKLHFKPKGYEVQSELFTKAFIDLIEKQD